ncbi:MAG: hypothetical protein OXI33_04840 [Chloroflexota bacterium]|nr:hypothetical protein [Chloroflexota bacterium]
MIETRDFGILILQDAHIGIGIKMNVTNDQLSDSVQRQAAWDHARDVLSIPAFRGVYHMVTNCGVIERILMDHGAKQRKGDGGNVFLKNDMEITALSDYWILGFFEIMRIIKSSDYRMLAEFPFDKALENVHEKANQVRTSFAKLKIPGKTYPYILPSHSGMGPEGTTYAVYDGKGQEVDVRRRELADQFLSAFRKYKKSRQYDQWRIFVLSASSTKGSYDSEVDGPTGLQVWTWRIEGVISNRKYWGFDVSNGERLTETKDRKFMTALLEAERNKASSDAEWDASRLAKELWPPA